MTTLEDTYDNRIALAKAALASLGRQHSPVAEGEVSLSDLGGDILDAVRELTKDTP